MATFGRIGSDARGTTKPRSSGPGRRYRCGALVPVVAVLLTALPLTATALDGDARQSRTFEGFWGFVGFWQGIDPLDGSSAQVSISDIEGDGILEFVNGESFWTVCFDLGDNYSLGRGLATGQGRVVSKGVLEVVSSLTCFDDDNHPTPLGEATIQWTLASHGRILVQPGFDESPDILLHRTAR